MCSRTSLDILPSPKLKEGDSRSAAGAAPRAAPAAWDRTYAGSALTGTMPHALGYAQDLPVPGNPGGLAIAVRLDDHITGRLTPP